MFTGYRATGRNVYWLWGNWLECLLAAGQLGGMFTGGRATGRNIYWL